MLLINSFFLFFPSNRPHNKKPYKLFVSNARNIKIPSLPQRGIGNELGYTGDPTRAHPIQHPPTHVILINSAPSPDQPTCAPIKFSPQFLQKSITHIHINTISKAILFWLSTCPPHVPTCTDHLNDIKNDGPP